jgi:hypothetical protein
MYDIKIYIILISNWLYKHFTFILVGTVVTLIFQFLNRWDWSNYLVVFLGFSGFLDWIWYLVAIFTITAFINWFVRKLWNYLDTISFY